MADDPEAKNLSDEQPSEAEDGKTEIDKHLSKVGGTADEKEESCNKCDIYSREIERIRLEKGKLRENIRILEDKYDSLKVELENEIEKRCDLEERFHEEAKRTADQIEELIKKSDSDDVKLSDLKKKFELYSRDTSSIIDNFASNRELLTSQLLELRQENDYLLEKYMVKSRDLQNSEINLPQTVEDLQFHCLTLNEKLILATIAKERLEETLARLQASQNVAPASPQTNKPNATGTITPSPEHQRSFLNRHQS